MIESFAGAVALSALGGLGGLAWWVSRPPRYRTSGDLRLHRLDDGVYMYRGFFSNSAVFVLPKSVVVVDTQVSPLAARRMRAEIEKVTSLPITHVINTHYHGDHTGGNAVFPEAEIIASEDTARLGVERDSERLEYAHTFGLEFVEVHPTVSPTRTFSGSLRLEVGGDVLEVRQIGRVETSDASVVFWPSRGAVAAGDGVATRDYPYLGVPFLDEGLKDDGQWLGFLNAIKAQEPRLLIAGHGPPLIGREAVRARLETLAGLFGDLLGAVRDEIARGTPVLDLVVRVDRKLAHYRRRSDLREHTVSQRFAIYRALNSLSPDRRGKGWWHDFRPSVVRRSPQHEVVAELDACGGSGSPERVHDRARALLRSGRRDMAVSILEAHLRGRPGDADGWALLSDVCFESSRHVRPAVDATEYIAVATGAAKRAVALDPKSPLGLLNLGSSKVFGGMVLAQPMTSAIEMLERALATGTLDAGQRRRAWFFLGRAHQMELRDAESDRAYARILPAWGRFLFPLVRERLRAYP